MRLGIRRKLIGTLVLVGMLPLAISLVVVLGGGAAIQLGRIRASYDDTAARCADRITDALLHEEIEKLALEARLPEVVAYVRARDSARDLTTTQPKATEAEVALDKKWRDLLPTDPPLREILQNPVSERLREMREVDGHPRQTLVTNAGGRLIAADAKTDDYFQGDEGWWISAFNGGKGRLYISTIQHDPVTDSDVVAIALPIYDTIGGKRVVIGILKDKIAASWVLNSLHELPQKAGIKAHTQLVDLDSGKTMYMADEDAAAAARAEKFYIEHRNGPRVGAIGLLLNDIVIGSAKTGIGPKVLAQYTEAETPQWAVLVSKRSEEAMTPVYSVAGAVAAIGMLLILVLFVLGVAISNREIIMPILRLREATAAVGRGELNVRVLSGDAKDTTFRKDELGELAQDFDTMTRQLQKSVQTLQNSNESRQRFMELASHELLTPVTFIMGSCPIVQKQLQQIQSASAASGGKPDERAVALAARNTAAVQGVMARIDAKTQRLSRIIKNLLKLVGNNQFTTRLNRETVDVGALIQEVATEQRAFLNERKQTLILDISDHLPTIEADREKLEDALTNLLSNAIRFSPENSTVRVAAEVVLGDKLEILVEDSGPGIPEKDLANLFEPMFTGLDVSHHTSEARGMGLGLALVRRFVELHNGVVRAHIIRREGRILGTRFEIQLPLNRSAEDSGVGGAIPGPAVSAGQTRG